MNDYISRAAVLDEAEKVPLRDRNYRTYGNVVRSIPAADVVEVVRCRDCEWWGHAGCAISIVDDTDKPGENDFCSFGERKDGGQDA